MYQETPFVNKEEDSNYKAAEAEAEEFPLWCSGNKSD